MNPSFWKRRALHGLALLVVLAAALGVPPPARAAAPANDAITGAVNIPAAPATLTMIETDFNDAYPLVGEDPNTDFQPTCARVVHAVWYSFVPTAYGQATITTSNPSLDTVLSLWTGPEDNPQEIACNDNATNMVVTSQIRASLRPGVRYYIQAAQFAAEPGGMGLLPSRPTAPRSLLASTPFLILDVNFASASAPTARFGMYDNKSPVWRYGGTWRVVSGNYHYEKSIQQSTTVGNTASLTFDGDGFTLYFMKAFSYGNLDVLVDGVQIGTINQTNPTAQYQRTWTSPTFPNGVHTLELRHASKYVNIDAIQITAPPDLTAPAPINDLAASPGASYGSVNLSWTAAGDDGNDGLAAAYQVRYSPNPIATLDDWNAATAVTSGVPAPQIPGASESMTVSGLAPGVAYYFAVRAVDEQGNLGGLGNSPSGMAHFAGPPAAAGLHENVAPNWMYFGTWTRTSSAYASGGNYHLSSRVGNSAAFVFNGIKFTLVYGTNSAYGTLGVYVDGQFIGNLNQKTSTTQWKRKYYGPLLPNGQHTVQFVHASGLRANVDAILVIDTPDMDSPAPVGSLAAAPGTANGSVNLSWTAPAEDQSTSSGEAAYYLARYSLNPILTEDDWNAAAPIAAGIPTPPKAPGQPESMVVSGLTPGVEYYFAVRAYDDFDNAGNFVSVSSRAKSPAPAPAGQYDDKDSRFVYTAWALLYQSTAYQSYIHYSTVIGKTASFVFNGSDFSLIYTQNTIYGTVEVWVDGVNTGCTINQNGALLAQQTWNYSANCGGPLASGQHTVAFRHASGTRVNVDAIVIFP